MTLELEAKAESFRLAEPFRISNYVWTDGVVCTVTLVDGNARGRGEGVPVVYHGQTAEQLVAEIVDVRAEIEAAKGRDALTRLLPPGPARCAVDCALWELESRSSGAPVHALAGLPAPEPLASAVTVTLDTPDAMFVQAERLRDHPLLKVKLGGSDDEAAVRAVRSAAPASRMTVDANAGWTLEQLRALEPVLVECGVELVEQPLAPEHDEDLRGFEPAIPIAADESCQSVEDLPSLVGKYQAVVIKLDKAGGLSGALALLRAAEAAEMATMVSCMIGTSLGIAAARLVGGRCRIVDLDAPLYLAEDRVPPIRYASGVMQPTPDALWCSA